MSSQTSVHGVAISSTETPTMFASHGGEALLVQPRVHATGYHQDECAVGLRSIIVNTRQVNFHLMVVYFDCTVGLDGGSNIEKCKEVLRLVGAIKLPWLIMGDFNVTPEECVATSFFGYLGGTLAAPDMEFTCTSNGSDRLLDYAIASKELAEFIQARPFYDHPFRPHICGVDFFRSLD